MGPAAGEDRLGLFDEAVDLREIRRREVVQALGADLREVDLVEHRPEEVAILRDFLRQFLKHFDDAIPGRPLHHDHRVVVFAELLDVIDPEFVVVALGVE